MTADLEKLVKPLVWGKGIVDYAKPFPGVKYVSCSTTPKGSWAVWLEETQWREVHPSEDAAKAAAQADYASRIAAALAPDAVAKYVRLTSAQMVQEAVQAEREACAKLCDEKGAREQVNFGLGRETQNYFRARDAIRARGEA